MIDVEQTLSEEDIAVMASSAVRWMDAGTGGRPHADVPCKPEDWELVEWSSLKEQ